MTDEKILGRLLEQRRQRSFHLKSRIILALEDYARRNGCSVNEIVSTILAEWYDRYQEEMSVLPEYPDTPADSGDTITTGA